MTKRHFLDSRQRSLFLQSQGLGLLIPRIRMAAAHGKNLFVTVSSKLPNHEIMYFAEHLDHEEVRNLHLAHRDINDHAAEAIAFIIHHSPRLQSVDLSGCRMTAAGMKKITHALAKHPRVDRVSLDGLNSQPLNLAGSGRGIAEMLVASPGLEGLRLENAGLDERDLLHIADGLGKSRLRQLHLAGNACSEEVAGRLLDGMLGNRHAMEIDPGPSFAPLLTRKILEHRPLNYTAMRHINDPAAASLIAENKRIITEIAILSSLAPRRLLKEGASESLVRVMYDAEMHLSGISRTMGSQNKTSFPDIYDHMPPVPSGMSDPDVWFNASAAHHGLAPLDNPRLFADAAEARRFLHALPMTAEWLHRETPNGCGPFNAVLMKIPLKEVLEHLNQRGQNLDTSYLLKRENQPSALMAQLLHSHCAGELFSRSNLAGVSLPEARGLFRLVPAYQRYIGEAQLMQLCRAIPMLRGR